MYVVLAVEDVARAEEFYGNAFGWKRSLAWPETYTEHPVEIGPGKNSGTELYVHVEDIDAAIERLRDAGARPLSPRAPREWGDEGRVLRRPGRQRRRRRSAPL